jgi:hypothetical protein
LLRGTLFTSFYGSPGSNPGHLKILLRPQIRYYEKGDLDYIIPTDAMDEDQQPFIDIKPKDASEQEGS